MEDMTVQNRFKNEGITTSDDRAPIEALVKKAIQGDRKALLDLCQVITRNVLFSVLCVLHNRMDAEDVTQEVLIRVCRNITSLKEPKAFQVWLGKIVVNETNRYLTKNSKHGVVLSIDDYIDEKVEEDKDFLPLESAIGQEERNIVMNIVKNLPERQLQAVLMHYFDSLSVTEVAEAMGISKPTVSQYLSAARDKIKAELQKQANKAADGSIHGLAVAPIGALLPKVFQQEAGQVLNMSKPWAEHALDICAKITKKNMTAKATTVVPFKTPLIIAVVAIVAATAVYFGIDKTQPEEPPAVVAAVSNEAVGKVVYTGDDINASYVNPTQAVAETNSDFGELEATEWVILRIDTQEVIFKGSGGVVTDELRKMKADGMDGEYMLRFIMVDAIGAKYMLGGSFVIISK